MSTTVIDSALDPTAEEDGAADLPELPEAAERGSLTVAEKVVERVAGHAITQIPGAGAAPRRLLGVTVGEARPDTEATVTARVDGHTAVLKAVVAIAWPHSVRAVTDRLREHVRVEVHRIADIEVAQIDLEVVSFAAAATPAPRVK